MTVPPPSNQRILIVDDDPGVLRAAHRVLEGRYQVTSTQSPHEALTIAADVRPDLAICDVRMPEMSGFDLQRKLREAAPGIDTILMTGSATDPEAHLIRSLREGTFYFLLKPFQRDALLALVDRCLEVRWLRQTQQQSLKRMEDELRHARGLMESLLPPRAATIGKLTLEARIAPSYELGGDLYDYVSLENHRLAFILADVVGHGAPAALLTSVVKASFRSAVADDFDPASVPRRLRDALASFPPNRFVTLFAGLIDVGNCALTFVNAGHPPPTLCSGDGACAEIASNTPLVSSAFPPDAWTAERIAIDEHGLLALHTDGLTELMDEDGRRRAFDPAAFVNGVTGAAAVVERTFEAVQQALGEARAADDISMLVLQW